MSLWDNINKKRQRIKQGSGEKMRKKGDKGAPTPDQIKRAKGEEMEEGKLKQMQVRRQDMAKLAGLYSKAMKAMPGSPKQKAISKQINQYRKEMGLDESLNEVASDKWRDDIAMDVAKKNPKTHGHALELIRKHPTMKKLFKKGVNPMRGADFNDELLGTVDKILKSKGKKYMRPGGPKESVSEAKGKYASDAQMDDFLKGMEKHPDVKKMSKHYNRPVGDIVKALRARVSVSRLRGGNVYTLNFTDKDSKLKVKAKKQYAPIKEAVSPAQQAAIAISKKERGEKPKNECASEDDFKPHMMYDPKTGKGVMAKKYADHVRMDKMGYTHEKPEVKENYRTLATKGMGAEEKGKVKVGDEVDFYETERGDKLVGKVIKVTNTGYVVQSMSRENKGKKYTFKYHDRAKAKKLLGESRAYRDAMKSMKSRSATRGMATTKKDKDTEASDDDRKAANKNIIMQLRKAADLSTGAEIEFERGKGKVSRAQAQAALARFNALAKPNDKEKFQKSIRSLSDIKKILGR